VLGGSRVAVPLDALDDAGAGVDRGLDVAVDPGLVALTCLDAEPMVAGTWVEPASVSADWTVTSGLSPACRVRKTLMMIGSAGSPAGSRTVQMIEVLDCSPRSTLEETSVTCGPAT